MNHALYPSTIAGVGALLSRTRLGVSALQSVHTNPETRAQRVVGKVGDGEYSRLACSGAAGVGQCHHADSQGACRARSARLNVIIMNVKAAHLRAGKRDLCSRMRSFVYCHHRDDQKKTTFGGHASTLPPHTHLLYTIFARGLLVPVSTASCKPWPWLVQVAPANHPSTMVAHASVRA